MQVDRYVAERRRKQKKRRKYFWAIVGFLAVYFVALAVFFFAVRSPAFQANQIAIEGTSAVSTSTVMDLLQASVLRDGDSLAKPNSGFKAMLGFRSMLVWPDALPSSTFAAVPQIAGITISKNYFFHMIMVTVTERAPFAVWCSMPGANTSANEQCFWFDDQGIAFANTLDTQGGAILVIHDYASSTPLALDEPVLPAEFMPNLISIVSAIKTSGLDVEEVALNDLSLEQVNVTTVDGPTIYFSLRFPAGNDLAVLESLMAKPNFNDLQYIDFTVANRAFYK